MGPDMNLFLPPADPLGQAQQGLQYGQQQLAAARDRTQYAQQQQSQKALRDIFSSADISTPDGQAAAIKKVGAIDPGMAMQLQGEFGKQAETQASIAEKKAQTAKANMSVQEGQQEAAGNAFKETYGFAQNLMQQFQSDTKLNAGINAKDTWEEAHRKLVAYGDDLLQRYPNNPQVKQMVDKIESATPELVGQFLQTGAPHYQALQQQQKAPTGYKYSADGKLMPIEGGPDDPKVIEANAKAKRESLSDVEKKAKVRELAKSAGEVALEDDDAKFLGRQLASGDTSVLTNMGRGAQGARNVLKVRHAAIEALVDQGATPEEAATRVAEFQGQKAAERALGTRTANAEMAVSEAQNSAKIALDASSKVPRTSWMPVNRALQALESGSGSVETRRFGAAVNTFINTYARAISPTGTPTVSDKDHAREILSTADSPEQFKGVMDVLQQEMEAARRAPGQVKKAIREGAENKAGGAPKAGEVHDGYKFKGGDPSKKENWEKV